MFRARPNIGQSGRQGPDPDRQLHGVAIPRTTAKLCNGTGIGIPGIAILEAFNGLAALKGHLVALGLAGKVLAVPVGRH
jgi:hypothetical protein